MTIEEKYKLLTDENKKKFMDFVARLLESQCNSEHVPDSQE